MNRVAVQHEVDRSLGVDQQAPQEIDEGRRIHPLVGHHEAQFAQRRHGRDQVERETPPGLGYDRRLALDTPGGAAMCV